MYVMFSFFDVDRQCVAIDHTPVNIIFSNLLSSGVVMELKPPKRESWYDKQVHNQVLKSKRDYLKKHSKPFNTKILKGSCLRHH